MDTQLGIALSMAHEILEEDPELSPAQLHFRFSIGRNFLLETAKLRAFRELWSFYLDSLGQSRTEAFVNARNSRRPLSASDPHGNLLRLTTMATSGLLGGAQNMELTEHTLGGPKNGEAHLPVNILHLLRFEGRLDRLEDPLAGSHSIEVLTERLAETGWSAFQEIQGRGSASHVLCDPWFARRVAEEAEAEQNAHDQGKYPVIGSSMHPFGSGDMKMELSTSLWPLRRLAEGAEKERSK
jgi:methylmalonyl-CoA mutase